MNWLRSLGSKTKQSKNKVADPSKDPSKKRSGRSTIAGRRNYRRILAGALVAFWVLSLPVAAWTAFVGYQFVFSPDRAAGGAQESAVGTAEAQSVDDLDRLEAARSRAVEFSEEYLTLDPEEDEDVAISRIGVFLDPELDPANVAPAPPSQNRQSVLASLPVYARPVEGGVIEVHTRNRILVEEISNQGSQGNENQGANQGQSQGVSDYDDQAMAQTTAQTNGSNGNGTDGNGNGEQGRPGGEEDGPEQETTIQRLAVYVGVDDEGRPAVVDPPTLLENTGRYSGPTGVLEFTDQSAEELNPDGQLATRLDGYLAALYGRDESRRNLEQFFIDGAKLPSSPSERLEFIEVTDAKLRPRVDEEGAYVAEEAGDETLSVVYDLELWVAASMDTGPAAGMVVNQTHLLTAGMTPDGEWLLVGER